MKDRNISTEYTGVYTGIFPNMSPREIELEARVKDLEEKLKIAEEALQYYAGLYIDTDICDDQFFGYDAQQALQKISEVNQ